MEDKELTGREKSNQNLVHFKKGDTQNKVENGRLGGLASVEAKRRKNALRDILSLLMESDPPQAVKERLEALGLKTRDIGFMEAITQWASMKTMEKRTSLSDIIKFIELCAKYTGQEPPKEIVVNGGLEANFDKIKEMERHFDDK